MRGRVVRVLAPAWLGAALVCGGAGARAADGAVLTACRLPGVAHELRCGSLRRPLDPARPDGVQIDLRFAVLPALARNRKADPVLFFAGGPGQSALDLAGPLSRLFARVLNRRDVILIDQRGTGRSAPLVCDDEPPTRPLRDTADPTRQAEQLRACRARLEKLPYGDLRQFTTPIASADADAVRAAVGAERVNLVGASYGTRAALDYLRLFPTRVRRVVIDGVAPPDMVLPATFSPDAQAAFDTLLGDCERDAACHRRHPDLRSQWRALLASLPRQVTVPHPVTGADQTLTLTRDAVLGLVRMPLYAPAMASALPYAVQQAAQGRFAALAGLGTAVGAGGARHATLAAGMHFSVVCAEDMPRLPTSRERPGADFGDAGLNLYRQVCADWPRGSVPVAFYSVPTSPAPVLLMSGAIDPVTPPRHAQRVAQALGAKAQHVVVPNAGHGTMSLGCLRDVVFRFIDQDDDAVALSTVQADAACAKDLPRPAVFVPPEAAEATR